ncbi:hypothetical protein BA6E_121163 [Bacteroidales bacterium 6E]|nr:hypothetical protein BA6E_121163 [Bacteroidales bacterium 6E]
MLTKKCKIFIPVIITIWIIFTFVILHVRYRSDIVCLGVNI